LRAVLRLLGEPRLLRAAAVLQVQDVHAPLWCVFHEPATEQWRAGSALFRPVPVGVRSREKEKEMAHAWLGEWDRRWLDVDTAKLFRVFGEDLEGQVAHEETGESKAARDRDNVWDSLVLV
jgi:hypothetical protein